MGTAGAPADWSVERFVLREAVRTALREAAARRRVRSALRDEVIRLAADEGDREEMLLIREQMAELAPPSTV
jgi:hypothetical protein